MSLSIDEINDLVRIQLGVKQVNSVDRIIEDLGAESADIVNIIAALEDKFQILIDEEEIGDIRTVEDLFDLTQSKLQAK
jgi:acyl carrier protein